MKNSFVFALVTCLSIITLEVNAVADTKPVAKVDAASTCATDQKSLTALMGEKTFQSKWSETTADDGKPLKIDIETRNDSLYFIFDKTNEGIWAEGKVQVCKDGRDLLAKISGKDIKVGEKAPRLVRWSMGGGATFRLALNGADKLHVSTSGWSGDFVPRK